MSHTQPQLHDRSHHMLTELSAKFKDKATELQRTIPNNERHKRFYEGVARTLFERSAHINTFLSKEKNEKDFETFLVTLRKWPESESPWSTIINSFDPLEFQKNYLEIERDLHSYLSP